MNKIKTLSSLNNIADKLDNSGLFKEANSLTNIMVKIAQDTEELETLKNKINMVTNNISEIQKKIQYYMREMEYLDLRKSYEMEDFYEFNVRLRRALNELQEENLKLKIYVSQIQEHVLTIKNRPNIQKEESISTPPNSPSSYSFKYENGNPVSTQTDTNAKNTTDSERLRARFE